MALKETVVWAKESFASFMLVSMLIFVERFRAFRRALRSRHPMLLLLFIVTATKRCRNTISFSN